MGRFLFAAAVSLLALAGPAAAMTSTSSIQAARPPSVPEPAAAVLFAVGLGVGAWSIRRPNQRS